MADEPPSFLPYPPRSGAPRLALHVPQPALMLAEVRDHADRGAIVSVIRAIGGSFHVVRNGGRFLVRSVDGDPLATVDTVLEAVLAGDAHLDHRDEDDFDDEPRGVA